MNAKQFINFAHAKVLVLRLKITSFWRRYSLFRTLECAELYLRDRIQRRRYRFADPNTLPGYRQSDVVFVFGSGASLQDVPPDEWEKINQHDTFGWRLFVYQEYVDATFLMAREIGGIDYFDGRRFRFRSTRDFAEKLKTNPRFKDTVVIIQEGWSATSGNRLFGHRLLPEDHLYMRYHNGARDPAALPASSFDEGVTHGNGTLTDVVNIAYLGGWKHIVLIGVDLYDNRYFLTAEGDENERRVGNPDTSQPNSTALSGIVQDMQPWVEWLNQRGVTISVYNPRSLMAEIMPVFNWDMIEDTVPIPRNN